MALVTVPANVGPAVFPNDGLDVDILDVVTVLAETPAGGALELGCGRAAAAALYFSSVLPELGFSLMTMTIPLEQ